MYYIFKVENLETSLSRTAPFSVRHVEHSLSSNISASLQHPTLKHADYNHMPSLSAPPTSLSLLSPSLITISFSLLYIFSSFSGFFHLKAFPALFFYLMLYNKEENSSQKKKKQQERSQELKQ